SSRCGSPAMPPVSGLALPAGSRAAAVSKAGKLRTGVGSGAAGGSRGIRRQETRRPLLSRKLLKILGNRPEPPLSPEAEEGKRNAQSSSRFPPSQKFIHPSTDGTYPPYTHCQRADGGV